MSCSNGPKSLAERVAKFARNRHPAKTAANVAADAGLGGSQVKAWLDGRAAPSGAAMLALISAYGPQFLAHVMPESLGWLDDAVMAAREDALRAEIDARQKQLDDLRKRL